MQTVAQPQTPRKPAKVFYAILNDSSGILGKINDDVLFLAEGTGTLTAVTSYHGLVVLGELGLADAQHSMDLLHGGAARIACQREV